MEILRTVIAILIITSFTSCNKDNGSGCFTSVGDIVYEERNFDSPFNSLSIYDNATVTIKQGPVYKAVVRGGSNLIESYKTSVENNILVIENKTICNWARDLDTPFEVYITMPELDSILLYGYGDLYSDGLFLVNKFTLDVSDAVGDVELEMEGDTINLIQRTGATNLSIKGNFNYTYVYCTSYSIIDLSELESNRGFYVNAGTGNMWINTLDYIKIKLELTGNIYYTNDPEIYIETHTGSGQLIPY